MSPSPSQRSFSEADRHNDDGARAFNNAFADLGSSINDTWMAGMARFRGTGQTIQENVSAASQYVQDTATSLGHGAMNGVREMAAETSDVRHSAERSISSSTHAYEQRQADFDRTRPAIAGAAGLFGLHDAVGLAMGGNSEHMPPGHPDVVAPPVHHDAPPPPPHHDAAVGAAATGRSGFDQSHHHTVKAGDSYWSIASAEGGSKKQIADRSHALQVANHNERLLPGLIIDGV